MAVAFAGTERFVVVRELGTGGMGAVYEAYDRERDERVALKTLLRVDPLGIHRFKREFRALADVAHPNLVSLYELHADRDNWFFTMELLDGVTFMTHVRRAENDPALRVTRSESSAPAAGLVTVPASDPSRPTGSSNEAATLAQGGARSPSEPISGVQAAEPRAGITESPLDETRLRSALGQLASGLYTLHDAGRLHRDIKPSNVFVTTAGRVVLLDFGLVLERGDESGKTRAQLAGTPEYMSPEQFSQQRLTPASDWYAVGLMLYEALTGKLPFVSQNNQMGLAFARLSMEPLPPRDVMPSVPADLNYLCVDLLRVQADRRPTGPEILRRLHAATGVATVSSSYNASAPSTQLVGREHELSQLQEAYARAFASEDARSASVVIVHGRSGMGKSALVQHFLSELRRGEELVILQGRCYEQESVPYKALDTSIEAQVNYLLGLSEAELAALLPADAWALERVFPAFRRVDQLAVAAAAARAELSPRELRKLAFAALRELLARMSQSVRLVMHIDDLQWGDVESADLLEQVLRPPDAPPIFLLLSCRTEELERSPFMRALFAGKVRPKIPVLQLEVGPLAADDAQRLGLALSPQLDPDRARVAAQESGGSPLFMNELVRYVARFTEHGHSPGFAQQVTIEQLLRDRFEQLPGDARRLLEVIAVASRPIRETLAGEAARVTAQLRDSLRELRLGHLIRSAGAGDTPLVEAFHDRIRETMLSLLPADRARAHHLALALALERSATADAEMLAVHFAAAEQAERAAHYAAQAADQAAAALAFDRAARLYALALETRSLPPEQRHQLAVARADALNNAGRAREAADVYLAAAHRVDRARAVPLQSRAAGQLLLSGHIDEGFATLDHVLSALDLTMPSSRRRTLLSVVALRGRLWLRGFHFTRRAESELASDELLRIDTCWQIGLYLSSVDPLRGAYFQLVNLLGALALGEPFRIARSFSVEAGYASVAGKDLPRAQKLLATAEALANELDHPYLHGLVGMAQGVVAFMGEEDWARAGEACARGERIFREHSRGVTWELTNCQFFKLNSFLLRGQLAEMARQLPEALESAQVNGNLFSESFLSMRFLLMVRLANDKPEQARSELASFATRLSSKEYYVQHYWRLAAEVLVALYTGQPEAAWNPISSLWENLERSLIMRMLFHRIDALHLRGRAALAMAAAQESPKKRRHFLALVEADLARIAAEDTRRARPLALGLRAGVHAVRGEREQALSLLDRAALGFDTANMQLHAASARYVRASLLGEPRGTALREHSERAMRDQNVLAPERMASLFMPGFTTNVRNTRSQK